MWLESLGLKELFANNQFLSGGFLLMVLGAAAAYARDVPRKFFRWLRRRLFLDFEVQMHDRSFAWVNEWLAAQSYTQNWSRWLTITTRQRGREHNYEPQVIISPAPGTHWMLWKGYFLSVSRDRKDSETSDSGVISLKPRESFVISVFTPFRRIGLITQLLEEARKVSRPPEEPHVSVLTPEYNCWEESGKVRPRSAETVVLPEGMLDDLLKDAQWFLDNESWYIQRGIPYRRGYLLYGPPGNGKSSTCIAIASKLKMDICAINLGSSSMNDQLLQTLLSRVPKHSIVLIEDVDCVFDQREQSEDSDSHLTFSGLLNALDGVIASEGRLLYMTTNHIEKLDPALIREGRCDERILVENANADQGRRMFLRFHPGQDALAETFGSLVGEGIYCMAMLQGHLLKYASDPETAVHKFKDLRFESQNSPTAGEEPAETGAKVPA